MASPAIHFNLLKLKLHGINTGIHWKRIENIETYPIIHGNLVF